MQLLLRFNANGSQRYILNKVFKQKCTQNKIMSSVGDVAQWYSTYLAGVRT